MQSRPALVTSRCYPDNCGMNVLMTIGKTTLVITTILAMLAATGTAGATYEWRDHEAPFDFEFGNHIDTHQQSRLTGKSGLTGFLYITPGDETNADGVVIAKHGDCTTRPEGCTVGWNVKGRAMMATYCGHRMAEHPAWAIDPADMPRERGFTHFHWLGVSLHHDGLIRGRSYPGYVLKLTAVDTFVFNHHGEFLVTPGIDYTTHANIFASCEDWPGAGDDPGHGH